MKIKNALAHKTKEFSLSLKSVSEDGTFEGYASIFGNVDSYGEIVLPGAFEKSLARHKKEKTSPLLLWQHNPDQPIGVWDELNEDTKGLYGKGRLLLGVQQAKEAHILLSAGALQGLSIGYRIMKSAPEGDTLKLVELDLIEASVVSFPANRKARVETVKSENMESFARRLRDGDAPPIKEFEDILREVGISKSMAVAIASHGYAKVARSEFGDAEVKSAVQGAIASLRSI
jgi:HK97 family phage prohead protease